VSSSAPYTSPASSRSVPGWRDGGSTARAPALAIAADEKTARENDR